MTRRSGITAEHLWAITIMAGIFIFVNTHPIRPHDFWWHIAVGRQIVATHHIPVVDTFSYTRYGAPYPSYQAFWLMEVVLYLLYHFGGAAMVVMAQSILITSTYALLLSVARRVSGSWRSAALSVLLAAALGLDDWNVRPQVMAFFIAALYLWVIERYRRTHNPRLLVLFPMGMAIWVNSHGTFPLGLLIIGLGWLEMLVARRVHPDDATRQVWVGMTAAGIATGLTALLCNPRGAGILTYLRTLTTDPAVQRLVPEWAPPTFQTWSGALFLIGLLLIAALMMVSPQRPRPVEVLTFLLFGLLGLKTSRGVIWFGLMMTAPIARHLAAIGSRIQRSAAAAPNGGSPLLNGLITGMMALAAFLSLPWFKTTLPLPPPKATLISPETPIAATDYLLEEELPRQLFHAMPFGSYLIWAAQPDYPVFVDSRIELYPLSIWNDYLRISAAECDWEQRLARYGVRTLMLSPTEQPALVAAARHSPRWEERYADAEAVIFVRREVEGP